MKFFLDSADINEITEINKTGMIDGITTNPSLIAKTGQNFIDVISEITNIVNGPISAEVIATIQGNDTRRPKISKNISQYCG